MKSIVYALLALVTTVFRSRLSMQLEMLALRHQLSVYQRTCSRPLIKSGDRFLWSFLSRLWPGWKAHVVFVQPKTVIAWQKRRFRDYWAKLSHSSSPGRPPVSKEVRALIRRISRANPGWGSPRIVGELRKPGIDVAQSTVDKYRVHTGKPPSPTWKAFLNNLLEDMVSIDVFVVPTVKFKVLNVPRAYTDVVN